MKRRRFRLRPPRTKDAIKIPDFERFGKNCLRRYFYPAEYCARRGKIIPDVFEAKGE